MGGSRPRELRLSTGLAGAASPCSPGTSLSVKAKVLEGPFDSTGPADRGGVAVMTLGNRISIFCGDAHVAESGVSG